MHGDYYCEVCDRSWKTPELLEEHIANHVTCEVEGCSFTAAPKVVALHVKLQHDSGIFERIVKTSNREDVEKWREERKRNFPTLANIEQKKAARKEMDERGERIEDTNKSFKKQLQGNHKQDQDGKNISDKRKRNHSRNSQNKRGFVDKPKFLSTASLPNDLVDDTIIEEDDKISDDEWIPENKANPNQTPISNVLMALSSAYDSDDDDTADKEENISKQDVLKGAEPKVTESDDEAPLEEKFVKKTGSDSNIVTEDPVRNRPNRRIRSHQKNKPAPKPWHDSFNKKRPLTLLEKLLAKEIKQERNHILQCIRYIINENYFDAK